MAIDFKGDRKPDEQRSRSRHGLRLIVSPTDAPPKTDTVTPRASKLAACLEAMADELDQQIAFLSKL